MNITPLTPQTIAKAGAAQARTQTPPATQQVGQVFSQALDSLNASANSSDALIQKLAAGENVDLHQVMIASTETDIRFRVAMAMRDKLVDAYHEVMRMQV
ncbi:MAG: flagellar hook-basal body complex protein FliE [Anaerolineales bacterium]|nr:flagellar hook-basal body complex protein FliE [Anaerolineales bacterium]